MCKRTLGTIIAMLALFASTAWADSQVRIVRLSYTDGDVKLDRNDGQGFGTAFLNLPVVEGARLSTGADSYAEVEFEDGSTARLTPSSVVAFPELGRTDAGTRTLVSVEQGEVFFNLKHQKGDDFRVSAGNETYTPSKKSHFRLSFAGTQASVAVFDGALEMLGSTGQTVSVRKNETISLDPDDAGRYFLVKSVAADPLDDWDAQREKDYLALEQSSKLPQYRLYPDMAGYGAFNTVDAYGTYWRPFGVGYNWDPFGNGAWVSYPYAGPIFVSYAPWGWAPYRYGSWCFIPGVGWAWRPGLGINTWHTGPVFVNPPSGFVPPVAPPPRHPIVFVGNRPPEDFDLGHHPRGPITAGGVRPVILPADSNSTISTSSSTASVMPRPERTQRDNGVDIGVNGSAMLPRGAANNAVQASTVIPPVQAPPPVATPSAVTTPRPVRVDRAPVVVTPEVRPAAPQRVSSPAPSNATHFSPPPQSAPHYSPPPMTMHSSPSPGPSASRPSSGGGRDHK